MRNILILLVGFLLPTTVLADVALSSATRLTRAKASVSATVPLSSAVRHPGGSVPTPAADPWADYWTFDGSTTYLSTAHDAKLRKALTEDFTVVIGHYIADATETYWGWIGKGGAAGTYEYSLYSKTTTSEASSRYSSNGTTWGTGVAPVAMSYTTKTVSSMILDYNSGTTRTNLHSYIARDSLATVTASDYDNDNTYQGTGTFYICEMDGGRYPCKGRIYFVGIYKDVLTQADIEDLLSGAKHPVDDFSPVFYIDFQQSVGATYTSEVGNIVLTVAGTPTKGP